MFGALFCQVLDASAGKSVVEHAGPFGWALRGRPSGERAAWIETANELSQRDRAILNSTSNYARSEISQCRHLFHTNYSFTVMY